MADKNRSDIANQVQGILPTSNGGVPTGGTTGQALTKNSNSDNDVHWSTIAAGVTGPGSSTDSDFAVFDGTSGGAIKDPGWSRDTDGTLAANSDSRIATQKAVKTFVLANANAPPSPVQSGAWGTVDAPPASATAYDDEFNGSSLSSQWSWVNQGGATATVAMGMLSLFIPAASGDNERGIVQTLPAGNYQFDAKINVQMVNNTFPLGGMALYDGTKLMIIGVGYAGTCQGNAAVANQNSVTSSWNTNATWGNQGGANFVSANKELYVRVKDDGTNLTWSIPYDGVSWRQLFQAGRTAFFPSGATKIGFLGESNNSSNALYIGVDWIRRTA